jgi:23S rRNA (adenine2503-C2)-methyltransferase
MAGADGEPIRAGLTGRPRPVLRALAEELSQPAYRGDQLFQWIHRHRARTFDAMTNLPKAFRDALAERYTLAAPQLAHEATSVDGTKKLLVRFTDGAEVECVLIPDGERLTLCISTQVGCALACRFCATGTLGFKRNLTSTEVIEQVLVADDVARRAADPGESRSAELLEQRGRAITNVVLMGMGEPLLNPEGVRDALEVLTDDKGFGLSPQKVTLSTVGVLKNLWTFVDTTGVNLAISLHAPDPALRAEIMPIERLDPMEEILRQVRERYASGRPRVTFEYVLLREVNDRPEHARALGERLRGIRAKVNLMAFNPHEGAPYERPEPERIERFRQALVDAGVDAYVRRSRGRDIAAACGQLAKQADESSPIEADGSRLREPTPGKG